MVTNKNRYMIYLLPIRCVIFAFIFVMGATIINQKIDDVCNWWSIIASAVNIFIICILLLFTKKNESSYRELINYRKGETKAKHIIGISLLIFVIGMAGMYVAGYICYGVIPYVAPMMIAPIPVWLAVINVVVLPVTTAFAEDGLYLGCGVNQINNKFFIAVFSAFRWLAQRCRLQPFSFLGYMDATPFCSYR